MLGYTRLLVSDLDTFASAPFRTHFDVLMDIWVSLDLLNLDLHWVMVS